MDVFSMHVDDDSSKVLAFPGQTNQRADVVIIMTTLAHNNTDGEVRAANALFTVDSWRRHIKVPARTEIDLHISDDGSSLPGYPIDHFEYYNTCGSRQEQGGVGASLNAGLRHHPDTDIYAYFVDDWALTTDLDLQPWIDLLNNDHAIGMVRLGLPHPWITGEAIHDNGLWYWRLQPHHYAFGHRPALIHRRMHDRLGYYKEKVTALECEKDFNDRWIEWQKHYNDCQIVQAVHNPFQHLDGPEFGEAMITP